MAVDLSDPRYLTYLKDSLTELFDNEELKELCFGLGIDYEHLPTDKKPAFTRELVLYVKRRGELESLISACARARPRYDWRKMPGDTPNAEAVAAASSASEVRPGHRSQQAALDAEALDLARQQLDFSGDTTQVAQADLDRAFMRSSRAVRVTIFQMAYEARRNNWFDRRDRWKLERTIPMFRALIASDVDERYHRNHANLAYALKDKRRPDWEQAKAELDKAIEIRGPAQDYGYAIYEFNRAVCAIMLEGAAAQRKRSNPAVRRAILADLRIAMTGGLADVIERNERVVDWLRINRVTLQSLKRANPTARSATT
jgi:hypothetical protein